MALPQKKVKATRVNPRKLIIFSQPKNGKTSCLAELEDNLIIDLERGTGFVEALKIDVIAEAEAQGVLPLDILKSTIKELNEVKAKIGKNPYKRITIDTVSLLEEMVLPMANDLYRNTSLGANWMGNDVRKLAQGAGYSFLQSALFFVINQFERVCDTLILSGHVRRKDIKTEDSDIDEKSLSLTGKTSLLVSADADAIAFLYREDNKTILNFAPSTSALVGSRCSHLRDKQITIAESDENGVITVNWDQVFLKE
jgi:hypothetical protein